MTADTALYIGEAGNYLADGTLLITGVTVANVPNGEAEGSELWDPIEVSKPADSLPAGIFDGGGVAASPSGGLDGDVP